MSQATPPPLPDPDVWRDGELIVMLKDAELPARCVKTNGPVDKWQKKKFQWHEPWVYATILAGLVVYAILAIVLRKTAEVSVPLSAEVRRKKRVTVAVSVIGSLLGVAMFVAGVAMVDEVGWLAGVGPVVFLVFLIFGLVTAPVLKPTRIDDDYIWLKGACPEYLAGLRELPRY